MYTQRCLAAAAIFVMTTATVSFAQSVTSAHSGTLHYFEGAVSIDGTPVESKVGKFSEVKEKSVLRTGEGRAEILLTPGVFLRVAENSAIRMLDNRLLSTRVEFLSGTAMIESDDPSMSVKDPAVTLLFKDYEIQPLKYGVLEITSNPAQLKVYKGQVQVVAADHRAVVKEGHLMPFSAALVTEKFDEKQADDLYLWTRDRSSYISAANMSSARTLSTSGYSMNNLYLGGSYPGLGFSSALAGGWYLNPYLNMYTYMPFGGVAYSPFGYGFFSPGSIDAFYYPGSYYWYGGARARGGSYIGQPLSGSGITRAGTTTLPRLTGGNVMHPTLNSPIPGMGGNVAAYRSGGFAGRGFNSPNTGFNGGNQNSSVFAGRSGYSGPSMGNSGAGAVSAAPSGMSGGGAAAGGGHSMGGGGGGGARGR
jgi:hypothetical protein